MVQVALVHTWKARDRGPSRMEASKVAYNVTEAERLPVPAAAASETVADAVMVCLEVGAAADWGGWGAGGALLVPWSLLLGPEGAGAACLPGDVAISRKAQAVIDECRGCFAHASTTDLGKLR